MFIHWTNSCWSPALGWMQGIALGLQRWGRASFALGCAACLGRQVISSHRCQINSWRMLKVLQDPGVRGQCWQEVGEEASQRKWLDLGLEWIGDHRGGEIAYPLGSTWFSGFCFPWWMVMAFLSLFPPQASLPLMVNLVVLLPCLLQKPVTPGGRGGGKEGCPWVIQDPCG